MSRPRRLRQKGAESLLLPQRGAAPNSLRATMAQYLEAMAVKQYAAMTCISRASLLLRFCRWCEERAVLFLRSRRIIQCCRFLVAVGLILLPACVFATDLTPLEQLGKQIFFDKNLSSPTGQACASCHAPEVGFSGPDSSVNQQTGVYPGAAPGAFGNRKPPSAAYAAFSPKREYNAKDQTWIGGQFWDGRMDDLVAQAKGPFLNPLEMNNASAQDVVDKVRHALC